MQGNVDFTQLRSTNSWENDAKKMCRIHVDWNIGIEEEAPAAPVIRLEPSQAEQLAGVLSRAFYNEPNFKYMIADEQERLRLLPALFRIAVRASLLYGESFTTQTVDGGALWISPGGAATRKRGSAQPQVWTPRRMVRTGGRAALRAAWPVIDRPYRFLSIPQLGWANFRRCMTVGRRLEEIRGRLAPGHHWYLMALGVEPSRQRNGLGARLIEPILARADSSSLPCYLETFNERNLAFYKRQGFRIAAAGNFPGGPDFWAMIREPQSS